MMAGLLGGYLCSGLQVPPPEMFARCKVEEVGRRKARRV